MDLLLFTIQHDWAVLAPIIACSIAVVGVFFNRLQFYGKNKRDVVQFIHRLQRELQRGDLHSAQTVSGQLGGIIGEVAEEGVQILSQNPHNKEGFAGAFDITLALATRKLEQTLGILGTIGTIAPYLGLFGTVVRILITFGELAQAGQASGAPQIMFGIGSALIATAFGLIVAILAVTLNNYFRGVVSRYEDDFQLLKLVFLSAAQDKNVAPASQRPNGQAVLPTPAMQQPVPQTAIPSSSVYGAYNQPSPMLNPGANPGHSGYNA